jgi:hypothetical protein
MCSINYDLIIKLLSLIGIIFGVLTYYRNTRIEKAKWLNQLHEKFFEKDTYKQIRIYIDYKTEQFKKLKEQINLDSNEDPILQETFVDYLNFFEFIATLEKLNQLEINEINLVFGYYIRQLGKFDFILKFIRENEFSNLTSLIEKITKLKS